MSNWQQQAYKKLKPIFGLLKETIINGPFIQMDETTVQVMGEENRKDEQKSYMWLARGGPPGKQVTLYEYHETRGGCHAKAFLEGYHGYLQTDGYEGYDAAVKELPGIIHVGCFAHSRRKFFEAAKVTEQAGTAEEGISYIKKLYGIERELRNKYQKEENLDKFAADRRVRAMPVLEEFKASLIKTEKEVPPSLLLGKAIGYSLNQWNKLVRYLDSPYLTPDNNACENAIRPFVIGRKNWLFNQSPGGAESSCCMYSLIQTAKQNGLVPLKYLTALFLKAPLASSPGDWEKLLPWNIFKE
jgi:transposase